MSVQTIEQRQDDASPAVPRAALTVVAAAALLAVLDGTVVAVALKPLAAALGSPLTTIVWTTIVYLLAAAAMLPLLPWLTARFGRRRVFVAGLVLFVVGSVLCALAWSAGALLAARVVQGFGGGLLEPTSLMLAAGMADSRNVGRVLGTMSMVINIAPIAGPVVGGLLLETGHWQWLFVINIPFGLAILAGVLLLVPADRPDPGVQPPRADVRGIVLLTVGYVAVLFALNRSGQRGADWVVIGIAVAGLLVLAGYARHALTRPDPAFDLRLLRRSGFAGALAVMGLVGVIMYSQLTSLPIFAEARHGLHGYAQGAVVTALGLGMIVSMTTGSRVGDRTGPRVLVRGGTVGAALGLAAFTVFHDELPLVGVLALFVGIGLSFGFVAAPTFSSVYRTLPAAEQPQGTTALFITVQLTASLAVALLGLLQDRTPQHWLTVLFAVATGAALMQLALSRLLPGRPA